ncbi:hypothetical protein ASG14_01420 [Pedobacter sp. Leaf194]|nr:hypothetical protein ASG14_01420 [Pedobacter sp. Leaf194]
MKINITLKFAKFFIEQSSFVEETVARHFFLENERQWCLAKLALLFISIPHSYLACGLYIAIRFN